MNHKTIGNRFRIYGILHLPYALSILISWIILNFFHPETGNPSRFFPILSITLIIANFLRLVGMFLLIMGIAQNKSNKSITLNKTNTLNKAKTSNNAKKSIISRSKEKIMTQMLILLIFSLGTLVISSILDIVFFSVINIGEPVPYDSIQTAIQLIFSIPIFFFAIQVFLWGETLKKPDRSRMRDISNTNLQTFDVYGFHLVVLGHAFLFLTGIIRILEPNLNTSLLYTGLIFSTRLILYGGYILIGKFILHLPDPNDSILIPPSRSNDNISYCSSCGTSISYLNSTFCESCGKPL